MPKLRTERLYLRPFRKSDADDFARFAGEWTVASMTSDIPHPFSPQQALAWLKPARGEVRFAVEHQGQLIGGAGYYRRPSGAAELGFWLGRPWWRRGFATEAAQAVIRYGFGKKLPGYSSAHFIDNPASARVLAKLGFDEVGRGRIACVARGYDVDAVTYWLDRKHAALVPAALRPQESQRPLWRSFLDALSKNRADGARS
jgi:RimJ/RimL family protein N-acetyltransferase